LGTTKNGLEAHTHEAHTHEPSTMLAAPFSTNFPISDCIIINQSLILVLGKAGVVALLPPAEGQLIAIDGFEDPCILGESACPNWGQMAVFLLLG